MLKLKCFINNVMAFSYNGSLRYKARMSLLEKFWRIGTMSTPQSKRQLTQAGLVVLLTAAAANSTVAETRCLIQALTSLDQQLDRASARVTAEAASIPGETFRTLWRDNLTNVYQTSADPRQQAAAFRSERRKVCAFAKSVGFQGTGYGISTTRCELALTQTLLTQLKP
jgi:hypothetical protein